MGFDRDQDARAAQRQEQTRVRQIADEQAQRTGHTRSEGFEPTPRARKMYQEPAVQAYKPGPAQTADDMGGAKDDPSVSIEVGPDGTVTRKPR